MNGVQTAAAIRQIIAEVAAESRVVPSWPEGRWSEAERGSIGPRTGSSRRGDAAGWSVLIEYEDASGSRSHRRISLIREEAQCAGHSAIAAFCHEANAYRLFRVDRIVAMATIDDGELIDPFEHIATLRRDGLPFEHKGMGTFAKALVFMARCDGHDHAMEWVAIEDALAHYAMRFGGEDDDIRAAICACRKLAPDSGDFANSLVEFYRTPQHRRRKVGELMLHSCAAIVDADGRHTDEEIAWGAGIGRAVRLMCQ